MENIICVADHINNGRKVSKFVTNPRRFASTFVFNNLNMMDTETINFFFKFTNKKVLNKALYKTVLKSNTFPLLPGSSIPVSPQTKLKTNGEYIVSRQGLSF